MIVNELTNIHPQVLNALGIYTFKKFITLFAYLGCFAYYPNWQIVHGVCMWTIVANMLQKELWSKWEEFNHSMLQEALTIKIFFGSSKGI
jgi:hypothetical protein